MNFTLSLAHLTVLDATPPQVVEAAHQGGFGSVGLRLAPARQGELPHPMQVGGAMLGETLARTRALGIAVSDVEVIRVAPGFDPDGCAGVLESAQALGARLLVVNVDEPDAGRAADMLARLGERAQRHDLSVGVEFMVYSAAPSLASARALVARAAHPAVHVLVDALHLYRSGGAPDGLGTETRRDVMQLNDAPRQRHPGLSAGEEGRAHRLLPGEGDLPLTDLLAQATPGAVLSVEAPSAIRSATLDLAGRSRLAYRTTADFLRRLGHDCH